MFHFRIVHFPIALLIVGAVLELLGLFFDPDDRWRPASAFLFGVGFLGALGSVVTGLWLYDPSVHDEQMVLWHRNLGIATLILSGITLLVYGFFPPKGGRDLKRYVRLFFVIVTAVLVGFTGHYGGTASHSEEAPSSEDILIQPPAVAPPPAEDKK